VTGLWTMAIGLLALTERIVVQVSRELFGITQEAPTSGFGVVLVIAIGVALMMLQYWCTMIASKISYRLGEVPAPV
jgi:hypothetical protein